MPPARPQDGNVTYLHTHRPFRVLGPVDTALRDYAEPQFVRPISEEHIARSLGEYDPLIDPDAEEGIGWAIFFGGALCGFVAGLAAVGIPAIILAWWMA